MDSSNPAENPDYSVVSSPENNQPSRPLLIQPRQPRNLQGLLRFAMEATKAEDAPNASELSPMAAERRKFLEEALKSLTVNVAEVLRKAIGVLTNQELIRGLKTGEPVPDDVKLSFNNILELIDDIDTANDFYKVGGYEIFPICLSCQNDEVRASACGVLAELCQNNEFCQQRALEGGLLHVLLQLLDSEQGLALVKCLSALSAVCRQYPAAMKELAAQGGVAALSGALRRGDGRARVKVAVFTEHVCDHTEGREQLIKNKVIRTFIEELPKHGTERVADHFLVVMAKLLRGGGEELLDQCRDPALGFKKVLEGLVQHENFKDLSQELLETVFENCNQDDEVAER